MIAWLQEKLGLHGVWIPKVSNFGCGLNMCSAAANHWGAGTQISRLANCSTIEQIEGDLDEHFQRDGMRDLIEKLTYSTEDVRTGRPPRHAIPIDGDVANGTSTYRAAANLYHKFQISR